MSAWRSRLKGMTRGLRNSFKVLALLMLATGSAAQEQEEREGGIIGTGIRAAGIYGTITELGSIYVNGNHILLQQDQRVREGVALDRATDLRPGHTVAVTAEKDASGHWQARDIRQILPLVGPVTHMQDDTLRVLGTLVELGGVLGSQNLQVGDWVAVNGLWQEDRVVASRLEIVPESKRVARVSGSFLGYDEQHLRIGGTVVHDLIPEHLRQGDQVTVYGVPTTDGIAATRLERGLFQYGIGLIQVEGYYSIPAPNGIYTVLGSGLIAFTDQPQMISTKTSVLRCGSQGSLLARESVGDFSGC